MQATGRVWGPEEADGGPRHGQEMPRSGRVAHGRGAVACLRLLKQEILDATYALLCHIQRGSCTDALDERDCTHSRLELAAQFSRGGERGRPLRSRVQ